MFVINPTSTYITIVSLKSDVYILKESQKTAKPKQTINCCNGEQAWVTSK